LQFTGRRHFPPTPSSIGYQAHPISCWKCMLSNVSHDLDPCLPIDLNCLNGLFSFKYQEGRDR
jgi:hypothetical protein